MPKVTGRPAPTDPVQEEVEWVRKDVRIIKRDTQDRWITVPVSALTYGPAGSSCGSLAVHPDPFGDKWAVSCLPLGARLVLLDRDEDAVKVAEYLYRTCRKALSGKTESTVKAVVPQWVKEWCLAMNKVGKWVEPKPR